MKRIYQCSDSVTGIFSAIYDAWKEERNGDTAGIILKGTMEQQLFCEYVAVEETEKKTLAVERMIKKNLGVTVYQDIYYALMAHDAEKGNAIFCVLSEARSIKDSRRIMEHLSSPMVLKVFELSRNVGHEAHQFTGFLRFKELDSGILFAEITPKNQILTCIAEHFSNRFPLENFMIFDKTHGLFLVHRAKMRWLLVQGEELNMDNAHRVSDREKQFEKLWKGFCKSISITERKSIKRQMQHLPQRYQQDMVEFEQNSTR